jgi:hypothetical protein
MAFRERPPTGRDLREEIKRKTLRLYNQLAITFKLLIEEYSPRIVSRLCGRTFYS